jgi:hypothetical protein
MYLFIKNEFGLLKEVALPYIKVITEDQKIYMMAYNE